MRQTRERRRAAHNKRREGAGFYVMGPGYDSLLPSPDTRPDYLATEPYVLAVDTETTGFNWMDQDRPFLATISDFDRDWCFWTPSTADTEFVDDGRAALREALLAAESLVFHNAPFDIHHLVALGVATYDELLAKEIHDTDILARVLIGVHDTANYKLKTLASTYVDPSAKEGEQELLERMVSIGLIKSADRKSDLPDGAYYMTWKADQGVVEKYALQDTRITYDLFYTLLSMADEQRTGVYELERRLQPTLIRMEARGIRLDRPRMSELLATFEIREAQEFERLVDLNGGETWDPGKKSELLRVLEEHGVILTDLTDTGEIRTDKNVLMRHSGTEVVDALLDWRVTEKFLSTYLRPLSDRDVVHPSFIQCGAWTGRMACMRPNMQNVPVRSGNEVRSAIIPREGHSLIVADYSSIELRLLAYYANHDELWEIINNGDPFVWLGEQIYGTPNQDEWPVKRQNLKNGFYAMTYGAGGPKLASTIGGGMTPAEGRALRKKMEQALGEPYRVLNGRLRAAVKRRGYVRTIGGRVQQVLPEKAYVALNALIQGSSADIMKTALARAEARLSEYDAYPVLTVHDEIDGEAPTEHAEAALEAMCAAMRSAQDLDPTGKLVLKVEGVVCHNNWGEAKG